MANSQISHRQLPSEAEIRSVVDNPKRLEAVRVSESWRIGATAVWNTLTDLVVRILEVPVGFVAVVQRDQDEYPSHCGLPDSMGNPAHLSGQTFCHFTLALDEMLVIGDTHQHERMRGVPTVASMGVRAYIGVPMRINGQVIGSFCVVDTVPRTWSSTALDTVAQLAASAERELSLRQAVEQAEANAQRASHFAQQREALVATVSHDLRTPLQVVQFTALTLKKKLGAAVEPQIDRILHASESLRRIAEVLVSERNLQEADTLRQPTSLRGLVDSALGMMSGLAERADISLCSEHIDDVQVMVDDGEMLRVLANLIGNSLKYTPPGSAIAISSKRSADTVILVVADNGPGMSEADVKRAFEAGWQGDAGKARGDGSGLGLSIVANLVERQGGTVTIRSARGVGTSVEMVLSVVLA